MIGGTPGTAGYYNELVRGRCGSPSAATTTTTPPGRWATQGSSNVSHGCVNLSPADAQTYYNLAMPGDPITITGSTKAGKWDDGWTEWFLPWQQFVKGSALHEAVKAGRDGSSFVNPSALPASSGGSPLQAPPGRQLGIQLGGWHKFGTGHGPVDHLA